jgi:site-specific DNA-methyltransferase (adenine-specific)
VIIWDKMKDDGQGDLRAHAPTFECALFYRSRECKFVQGMRPRDLFPCEGTENIWHGTEKPVPLLIDILKAYKFETKITVLDPYAGSGSTCLAARRSGMHFLAFEFDEENARNAAARLSYEPWPTESEDESVRGAQLSFDEPWADPINNYSDMFDE